MTKAQALDVNWLKKNCQRLYFFGLGFIQIKINDDYRVHIYTDKLPRSTTEEDVHNHRYGFTSWVLKGTLIQHTFRAVDTPHGEFFQTKETCNPNNKKEFEKYPCDLIRTGIQELKAGSSYSIHHDTLHRVFSTTAVTLLQRGPYEKDEADVVYRKGEPPGCPFATKVRGELLWEIIEEALRD